MSLLLLNRRYFLILLSCLLLAGDAGVALGDGAGHAEQAASAPLADSSVPKLERWVEEKTGSYVPLQLEFVDENGKQVTLGGIIDRPTIILPIYFYCPGICSLNLANLAESLRKLSFEPGRDYKVIAFSFNELESSEDARRAKVNYLKIVGDAFPPSEWLFLTGNKENIREVTDSLGFRFERKDDTTFVHPSALMTLAKDGKIIRYVYGSFLAGDIDMALLDAQRGSPSSSVKRLLAFCFNYDPDNNKSFFRVVKVSVMALFVLIIGALVLFFRGKPLKKGKQGSQDNGARQDRKNE